VKQLLAQVREFVRDEEGLTTVEYAVAGGLIAAVVIVAFQALGVTVGGVVQGINDTLATEAPAAATGD
jgi:pilus assembly protein Flp/PilA